MFPSALFPFTAVVADGTWDPCAANLAAACRAAAGVDPPAPMS